MKIKNKKTFESITIKKYKGYNYMLWLIPVVCLLFVIKCVGNPLIDDFKLNPSIVTVMGIICFLFLATFIIAIVPFAVGKFILGMGLKKVLRIALLRVCRILTTIGKNLQGYHQLQLVF